MEGEGVVVLRSHAVARRRQLAGVDAGVVAALGGVAAEGGGVGPCAETPPLAGDDDGAHGGVGLDLGQRPPVLGVHPAGPGVQTLGPGEGDRRDAVAVEDPHDLEVHAPMLSPSRCTDTEEATP